MCPAKDGTFDWFAPDPRVPTVDGDAERIGTYLYGRRMYGVMAVWERVEDDPAIAGAVRMRRTADKVVHVCARAVATTGCRVDRSDPTVHSDGMMPGAGTRVIVETAPGCRDSGRGLPSPASSGTDHRDGTTR